MPTLKLADSVYGNVDSFALKIIEAMLGRAFTGILKHKVGLRSDDVQAFLFPESSPEKINRVAAATKADFLANVKSLAVQGERGWAEFAIEMGERKAIGGFSGLSTIMLMLSGPPARLVETLNQANQFDLVIRRITDHQIDGITSSLLQTSLQELSLPAAEYMHPAAESKMLLIADLLDLGASLSEAERLRLEQLGDNLYLSWLARLDIEFSTDQLPFQSPKPWLNLVAPKLDSTKIPDNRQTDRWKNGWYSHPNARLINLCYCLSYCLVNDGWPSRPLRPSELITQPGFSGDWRRSKQNPDEPATMEVSTEKVIDHWRQGRTLDYNDFFDIWDGCCNAHAHTSTPWPIFVASRFWALVLPRERVKANPGIVEQAIARYEYWWNHHYEADRKAGRAFHGSNPRPACFDAV